MASHRTGGNAANSSDDSSSIGRVSTLQQSGLREKREMNERLKQQDEALKQQDERVRQHDDRLKRQDERLAQQDERLKQQDERLKQQESETEKSKLDDVQQPPLPRPIEEPTSPMIHSGGFHQHNQQYHPANFHQATTYFCFAKYISGFTRVKFQLASIVLICLQLIVLAAFLQGIVWPNCVATWQCHSNRVCVPLKDSRYNVTASTGTPGKCSRCGEPDAQAKLKAYLPTPDFTCPLDDQVCRACYDSATGAFSNETYADWSHEGIATMHFKDWMTVVLTSGVIGLAVARKVQEIILCELTQLRLSQEAQGVRGDPSSSVVWIYLERLKTFLRRFCLLPLVLMCAVVLVIGKGGDALSVCFNALAFVFLLECDNLLYENVLDDCTRALVHDEGWVKIDNTAANFLAQTKYAHFVGLTVGIPAGIALHDATRGLDPFPQTLVNALSMYSVFPMIEIFETQLRMRVKAGRRCRAILVVLGKACLVKYLRFFSGFATQIASCKV